MKTEHHVDELFARLIDSAQEEVWRIADLSVDRPLISRKSEDYRTALSECISKQGFLAQTAENMH